MERCKGRLGLLLVLCYVLCNACVVMEGRVIEGQGAGLTATSSDRSSDPRVIEGQGAGLTATSSDRSSDPLISMDHLLYIALYLYRYLYLYLYHSTHLRCRPPSPIH